MAIRSCLLVAMMVPSVLFGCSSAVSGKPGSEQVSAAAPPPALVRVREVRQQQIAPRLVAVGTVRPRSFSIIASAADGVVDEFSQEQGSFVKAGTVLAQLRMESTELALDEQRAVLAEKIAQHQQILEPRKEDVEEAEAQHLASAAASAHAEQRLKELQSLASRGATNPSAVDDAELTYNEVRHRLLAANAVFQRVSAGARDEEKQQANARLQAQEKHVAWLMAEKEKRITRAPFDGFLVQEQTYLGQWLSKGDPVATMVQLDEVDVEIPVDQGFISQVAIGHSVRLKIAGTPDPSSADGRWTGTVNSIVPRSASETGSRSFPVIVRIKNRMNGTPDVPIPTLREGMVAEAEFFGSSFQAILVPKDTLVRTSRGTFVFAINSATDGKPSSVRQVMVQPGISQDEWIQVSGSDLESGMLVVTEGAERLRPFQSVQLIQETSDE
ncbi:MAG: HlyD family efflux transporter periplasmic adaptor subunit [Fuerstiella sp.]|nr:HlyD family efflux transporter periplasmic adaptor subunit [Fuerstiella sp.]